MVGRETDKGQTTRSLVQKSKIIELGLRTPWLSDQTT